MIRVNIGCGPTPIKGWYNYDNSISVHISRFPRSVWVLGRLGFLSKPQIDLIKIARVENIIYADATTHIPHPNASVDIIYSSHMIEHLDRSEATSFLSEAYRTLIPGGILRISTPDLKKMVCDYIVDCDAGRFLQRTLLTRDKDKTFQAKLKYIIVGDRSHQVLYDFESLKLLLQSTGFINIVELPAGSTSIKEPGELDLYERESESMYVEAIREFI